MSGKPKPFRYIWKDVWRRIDRAEWRRGGLRQIDKHVLHVLFEHMGAGADPNCWPEQETIGDEMAVRRDTVADSTERLEATGWIRREKRGCKHDDGWHYVYWATIPERLREQEGLDADGTRMSREEAETHSEPDMSTGPARHVGGTGTNHTKNLLTWGGTRTTTPVVEPPRARETPTPNASCSTCDGRSSGVLGWCHRCETWASDRDESAPGVPPSRTRHE